MFRKIQKYKPSGFVFITQIDDRTMETGSVVHSLVSQQDKVLPDPDLFELDLNIKTGDNLDEVNPCILSGSVDEDALLCHYGMTNKKTDDNQPKTNNNKEVNNEDE